MYLPNYNAEIEKTMIAFYESLSEKDRRRYAAVEAKKIGHGGSFILPSCLIAIKKPYNEV